MSNSIFTPSELGFIRFNMTDGSPEVASMLLFECMNKRSELEVINGSILLSDIITCNMGRCFRYWEYPLDRFVVDLSEFFTSEKLQGNYLLSDICNVYQGKSINFAKEQEFIYTLLHKFLKDKDSLLNYMSKTILTNFPPFSTAPISVSTLFLVSIFNKFLILLESNANLPDSYKNIKTIVYDINRSIEPILVSSIKFLNSVLLDRRPSFTLLSLNSIHSVSDFDEWCKKIRTDFGSNRIISEMIDGL